MKMKKIIVIVLALATTVSCKNEDKGKTDVIPKEGKTKEVQIYKIDTSGVYVHWTAFKFTERVGVSGIFEDYTLTVSKNAKSVEELMKNGEISINTQSVNSNSEIRDKKLRDIFFNTFHTNTIKGKITSAYNEQGTLSLTMNNISENVNYSYVAKNDTLTINSSLDLSKWNGVEAVKALNKECYDLHKGTDGVSKLWPDVLVKIKIPLKSSI